MTTDDAGHGADAPAGAGASEDGRRLRGLLQRFRHEDDERLAERIIQQWAQVRADRRPAPPVIPTGPSNFSRAQVPWGVDLAAAWAWRFLVICAAGYVVLWLLARFSVVTVPIAIALLVAAMGSPAVRRMNRAGLPTGAAAAVVVVGGLAFVGALLTFVGQQVATGFSELGDQVVAGLDEVEAWLKTGPLNATDSQINHYIEATQKAITEGSGEGGALSQVTSVGSAVGHVLAGFFIVLFATYFFLADGRRIWAWIVRLAPRAARAHIDSSGRVAWISLTQFVRATVIVAAVDALGIMLVALVLDVPFVLAIGVLVFLGSFVPMIGATVAGIVAVLVALVDQGPVIALLMLGGVILVQQVEGHVLQPFLMGRFVSLHPLGVIVAIGCGVIVAGVTGALVAVPLAAAVNAVVQHLASNTELGDEDPRDDLEEDIVEEQSDPPPVPEEGTSRD